ncbi:MAG: hypothetical protein AAGF83_18395 [Cyanobacteria bacterium P01_G01_bin.67]
MSAFLAVCLLTVSTACSQNPVAQTDGIVDNVKRAVADTYDDYDANQNFQGGMNGYNDDRRYDAETAAKSKALVGTALSHQKDNFGEYVENVVDRAENKIDQAQSEIPRNLQSNQEQAVNYIQDKSENLRDNLNKVPEGSKKTFNQAVDNAQDAIQDAGQATKANAERIKGNFQDLS